MIKRHGQQVNAMESVPQGKTPITIVDDDVGLLLSMRATIVSAGLPEPALISDSSRAMEIIRANDFHLILLDLIMPHVSGMELLQAIKEERPGIECIIITAVDDAGSAVQAMKFGAYDYLVKPINSEKLIITVNRALERYDLRNKLALLERHQSFDSLKDPSAFQSMIAQDSSMAMVFHQVELAAPTDYNVFLTGESGTGKEMIARIIHTLSNRSRGPFMAVNMASFSRTLFEDDFFGHVRGAYTGASDEKKGFFEAAQEGTLFLDEITELDQALQGKLLRVIQEKELYRLGSTESRNVDIRIISATNTDIEKATGEGHFRKDLFFRLNMFHIHVPPLRERIQDILPLANHFLAIHGQRNKKDIRTIDADLCYLLLNYSFPGNVRELENIISKAVLIERGPTLTASSVGDLVRHLARPEGSDESLMSLEELEKQHILRVLDLMGQNRTKTAKILGIGLRTLQRKLKEFGSKESAPN
jgi:DNA-binding NtrC family response regulator